MLRASLLLMVGMTLAFACGGATQGLNQTSITCPAGRTLLDGVCVSESVADYVACVRAQGAQLGGDKSQKISADVGTLGAHASGAAEVRESLEKKYAVSDAATLEVIKSCSASVKPSAGGTSAAVATRGFELFHDGQRVGFEPTWTREQGLETCRWNARTYPQKKVECAFDGQRFSP